MKTTIRTVPLSIGASLRGGCLLLSLSVTLLLCSNGRASTDNRGFAVAPLTNSPAELFMRFVANPPVIEQVLFSRRSRVDSPFESKPSEDMTVFEGSWQPDSLFLRPAASSQAATNFSLPRDTVAAKGESRWLIDTRFGEPIATTWMVAARGEFKTRSEQEFNDLFNGSAFPLRELLNFGIEAVDIGAIRWSGLRFTATNCLDADIYEAQGLLTLDNRQRPSIMNVDFFFKSSADLVRHHRIRYFYEDVESSPILPTRFTISAALGEQEMFLREVKILSLRTLTEQRKISLFDPVELVASNHWRLNVLTNNTLYAVLPGGRLEHLRSYTPVVIQRIRAQEPVAFGFIYVLWAGANVGYFAKLVRLKKQLKGRYLTAIGQKSSI